MENRLIVKQTEWSRHWEDDSCRDFRSDITINGEKVVEGGCCNFCIDTAELLCEYLGIEIDYENE